MVRVKSKTRATNNKFFFVRHGETFSNIGHSYDHPQRIRLTDQGHKQAKKLVKKIKSPDKIIVSKYFRTIETAQPLMEKHPHVLVRVFPHLHEYTYLNPKKFNRGKIEDEVKHRYINEYWERLDPTHKDGDIAESFLEFITRIDKTIHALKKLEPHGNVYIFTHGIFMRAFLYLHKEIDQVLKPKKMDKKKLKALMKKFRDIILDENSKIKNTQIIDATEIIHKY
jgi:alpha-ribazole phosphatase